MVALTAVALGFVIYPITEPGRDVINSDWPAFATGAKLALTDPTHLYDLDVQRKVQLDVTGGAVLATPGIKGILPFLAPAYVALIAVPFEVVDAAPDNRQRGPELVAGIGGELALAAQRGALVGQRFADRDERPPRIHGPEPERHEDHHDPTD